MKKFIAILLSALLVVAALAITVSADDAVIGLDRANHYDWTTKDFESAEYTPTGASAGEILVAASASAEDTAYGKFDTNPIFDWWYKIYAELNEEGTAFVITAIDPPGDSDGDPYETWTLGEGKLFITCNTGYASTEVAGKAAEANVIKALAVGDTLTLNGITLADIQTTSGALTDASVTVTKAVVEEPDVPGDALENLAAGKTYTASEQFRMGGKDVGYGWDENAAIVYEDENGVTLTDGVLPAETADYTAVEWAGWNGNTPPVKETTGYNWMTIDLGESYDLGKYVVWCGDLGLSNGIGAPDKIEVFVSEDGQTWGEEAVASVEPTREQGRILTSVELEGEATGRYVQFRFHCGTWSFLAELEVYEGGEQAPEESKPEESEPEESEPAEDLEAELKDFVGEAVDGKFDLVIDAPETYKAGDEITVTVTVANITAENGLHVVKFNFYYDSEKLVLTNDLDEEEDNRLVCIDEENLPSKWENFTKVNNDFDAENAEGTEVKALNDGIIYASALTDKDSSSTAIKEDGKVVFTFTFTANADAEGDIGLAIPHAEVEGALNNAAGAELYAGNGGYAIIAADAGDVSEPEVSDPEVSEPEESKPEEPVVPGDASNMLVFAIIALVAIAGSAVVIKTRK